MPLYSKNGLTLSGLRPVASPDLGPLGYEDYANSEHSGRWTGGAIVFRKMLWTDDTSFGPNTVVDELILQLPPTPNWGLYIMDAVVQAKVDVGSSPSGTANFSLGTLEAPSYTNIIAGPPVTPQWSPVVDTWVVNSGNYRAAVGIGGRTAYRTFRQLYLRMDNSGFTTLNNSPISITVVGYLLPDATDPTS